MPQTLLSFPFFSSCCCFIAALALTIAGSASATINVEVFGANFTSPQHTNSMPGTSYEQSGTTARVFLAVDEKSVAFNDAYDPEPGNQDGYSVSWTDAIKWFSIELTAEYYDDNSGESIFITESFIGDPSAAVFTAVSTCCDPDYHVTNLIVPVSGREWDGYRPTSLSLSWEGLAYLRDVDGNRAAASPGPYSPYDALFVNAGGASGGPTIQLDDGQGGGYTAYLTEEASVRTLAVIPEPTTVVLLGLGLLGLAVAKRPETE